MSELYELPDGWKWKKLINTIEFSNKTVTIDNDDVYNCIGLEHIESNTGKLIDFQPSKGSTIKSNKVIFEKDMVLYGKLRPYLNKVWKAEFSGIATTEILPFKPLAQILDSNYLAHYLRSNYFVENAMKNISGARMPRITTKYLKNEAFIPLPPFSEQQKIVSKLDKLFEKIDKSIALHQKNMDEADLFMGSILNDVFGELEEKYEKVHLNTISDLIDGDRGKNYPKKSEFFENGYCLFLNAKNVTKFGFKFNEKQFITKEKDELLRKGKLQKEDLIITTRGTIGNVSIYDSSVAYDNIRINSGMAILRIKDMDKLYNRFLYKYLYSPQFLNYLSDVQSGSAQPQITIRNLKESSFSIPPLYIQQKAVKYLDEISQNLEKLKSVQKEKMNSLKSLKASILDKAFRGEL